VCHDRRAGAFIVFIHAAVLGLLLGCATPHESRMSATVTRADSLLHALAAQEPVGYSLGTPELLESDEVGELVQLDAAIVPHLVDLTRSDRPRELAYVALVLGRIGDARALEPLRALRARVRARETKDMWDFAVIGQANVAIDRLERRSSRREGQPG
jgi:hypothetical protein